MAQPVAHDSMLYCKVVVDVPPDADPVEWVERVIIQLNERLRLWASGLKAKRGECSVIIGGLDLPAAKEKERA